MEGYVIIDASNNYYEIQRLQNILEEKQINYYVVPEEGAFELKI
jgi:competence protein ComEC